MRILISNDDGIQAEGLKALINSLQEVEDIEFICSCSRPGAQRGRPRGLRFTVPCA